MRSAAVFAVVGCAGCVTARSSGPTSVIAPRPSQPVVAEARASVRVALRQEDGTVRWVELSAEARAAAEFTPGSIVTEARARAILAPFGQWQTTELGAVWTPDVPSGDDSFVPYVTHGQWVESATGPKWSSVFVWGGLAFGYGRWVRLSGRWSWMLDGVYTPRSVHWRRSGAHVGWSVDEREWCFVDEALLYGPRVASRVRRGRAAAPLLAASVDAPEWWQRGAPGAMADVRGARPTGQNDPTTRALEGARDESTEAVSETVSARWSTVVIRDEDALARWEDVSRFETPTAPTAPTAPDARDVATRVATTVTPRVARESGASRVVPTVTGSTLSGSRMWADQECTRAPIVANVNPRWSPVAPSPLRQSAPPPVVASPTVTVSPREEAPIVPSGGGGVPGGVATSQPGVTVGVAPSAQPTRVPTVSTGVSAVRPTTWVPR